MPKSIRERIAGHEGHAIRKYLHRAVSCEPAVCGCKEPKQERECATEAVPIDSDGEVASDHFFPIFVNFVCRGKKSEKDVGNVRKIYGIRAHGFTQEK
jgi:hypothetical protein